MSQKNTTIRRSAPISYSEQKQLIEQLQQRVATLDKMLNARISRSVDIETLLISMAQGKLPLPNHQDCRVMALRLGTPKAEWSGIVASHQWQEVAGGSNDSTH
jgi:hypothetical protein